MNTGTHILQLSNHYTLGSNLPYLVAESSNKMLVVDYSFRDVQSIFARDKSSEEYRYVPFFFRECGAGKSIMVVRDGPTIRLIRVSDAKINWGKIFVSSLIISASNSDIGWVSKKHQPFDSFQLNLPCYGVYSDGNAVISLQNELHTIPIDVDTGSYFLYGRDGFGHFQMGRFSSSVGKFPFSYKVKFQFYKNSGKKLLDLYRYVPVFGYGDDEKITIAHHNVDKFKKPEIFQIPSIQSPPFFFIANHGLSAYFAPLMTPLCGYLSRGWFFMLTPDKQIQMSDYGGIINDACAVHIMRDSKVAAIYIVSFEKIHTTNTINICIYRLNEDCIPEKVYSLEGVKFPHRIPDNAEIVQDNFYIYYYRETNGGGQVSHGVLVLTEDGVFDIDISKAGKHPTSDFYKLWHFWPSPNVAVLYHPRKVVLIRGKDVIKAVDVAIDNTKISHPFFCSGKKIYVFDQNGKTETYFFHIRPTYPLTVARTTLLWDGNDS